MTIQEKRERIKELGTMIGVVSEKKPSRETVAKVQELQDRLEFRLGTLQNEFAEREADLKIEVMEEVYKILIKKH